MEQAFLHYKNTRQIRNLLGVSSEGLVFLVGGNQLALGYSKEARKSYECEIQIKGYLQWEFRDDINTLSYKDGVYRIPKQSLPKLGLSRFFPNIDWKNLLEINVVVQAAKYQRHGTVILISEQKHVQSETKRLCKFGRGISIKPINLYNNIDIITSITAMDHQEFDYYYGDESSQFSFYRIPLQLVTSERFYRLSTGAKLLYGLLLDRMSLSTKNGWHDGAGRVYIYYTLEEIQNDLRCAHGKAVKLLPSWIKAKGLA